MRRSLALLATIALGWPALLIAPHAPVAVAVEIGVGADRYSGSGGLLLPGSVDPGTRHEIASCADCRWRLSDPCSADGGPCLAVTRGCAQWASLLRIRFSADAGRSWSDRGLVCIPPSGPVTVTQVSSALHEVFERLVPELRPSYEPSSGVVTRLPVNFLSGQPPGLPSSAHRVLGESVVLRPDVRWSWDFGDGVVHETAEPGESYPQGTIRHAYRRSGALVATVVARWSGSFEVDGLGPFPVAGIIEQTARREVSVGEGRAVLVP